MCYWNVSGAILIEYVSRLVRDVSGTGVNPLNLQSTTTRPSTYQQLAAMQHTLVPGPVPNRSLITVSADITLILLSSAFVITRLYVRKFVSNTLGLDDGAALISLVRLSNQVPHFATDLIHSCRCFSPWRLPGSSSVRPYGLFLSLLH